MDTITRLLRRRNMVLGLAAAAFLIWQGADIAQELIADGTTWMSAATTSELIGAVMWVAATVAFLIYASQVSKHRAAGVINDEATRHDKSRAFSGAYLIVLFTVSGFALASIKVDLDAEVALRTIAMVAVISPIALFLWFTRDVFAPVDA